MDPLPAAVEVAAYRIAQEALTGPGVGRPPGTTALGVGLTLLERLADRWGQRRSLVWFELGTAPASG